MMVPEGSAIAKCEYCDSVFTLDDEAAHVKFDNAKQAGYEFERGRIRAQKEEAARRHAAEYRESSDDYHNDTYRETPSGYGQRRYDPKNWDSSQGAPTNEQKSWLVFKLIMTFLFGIIGVHKFMDGKIIMGIVYIFTFGLCGFGWFFDLIMEIYQLARMYSYR